MNTEMVNQGTPLSPEEARVVAKARMRTALKHVESAAMEMAQAAAELSVLVGAAPEWEAARRYCDELNDFWHSVNYVDGYSLDSDELERLAGSRSKKLDGSRGSHS